MVHSEIVLARLREICPLKKVSEMDIIEVEKATNVAFQIIGYKPKKFQYAFGQAWENSDATDLSDFIYDVWRFDDD